jgi:hypothetical protein
VGEVLQAQDTMHAIWLVLNWESQALYLCVHMHFCRYQNVQTESEAQLALYSIGTDAFGAEA